MPPRSPAAARTVSVTAPAFGSIPSITAVTMPPMLVLPDSTWLAWIDSIELGPPPPVSPRNTGPAANTPPTTASTQIATTHHRRRKHHCPTRATIPSAIGRPPRMRLCPGPQPPGHPHPGGDRHRLGQRGDPGRQLTRIEVPRAGAHPYQPGHLGATQFQRPLLYLHGAFDEPR